MGKAKNFSDFTYGVGLEVTASSFKQVKDELKLNLDSLSKMVKSYGKILKIDPNADLSHLFEEMKKIKSVVDGINGSNNSFGDFVDKGVLSRIASLESGLNSVSATSKEVEANLSGLKSSIDSITGVLKMSGQSKFPATFDNLFGNVSDQSAKIQNVKNQIKSMESDIARLQELWENLGFPKANKNWNGDEIIDWITRIDDIKSELSSVSNFDSKQLSSFVSELETIGSRLGSAIASMSSDQLKSFQLNDEYVITEIDECIKLVKTKKQELDTELASLNSMQAEYQQKLSAQAGGKKDSNKSLGVQSEYNAQVKVTPKTNDIEWVNKINDTIKNITPRLDSVHLTPTFSKSKNIKKEVEGNLAQINHAVNVDLKVTDNLDNFTQKIQKIDSEIKKQKEQLEKTGTFKIKFDYEDGGKLKEVAQKVIKQFKQIDAKLYISNGKKFILDIIRLKEKAQSELKNIPANVDVTNQDSIFAGVDNLRNEINKKIGNIDVQLNISNMPQFVAQAAMMRDGIEQYYNKHPIGAVGGQNSGVENVVNEMENLSDAAKKANEDLEKSKKILDSLMQCGFNSKEFLQLGDINPKGKKVKGSTEKLEGLLNRYKELQAKLPEDVADRWQELYPEANGNIQIARQMAREVQSELKQIESELNVYLQKQIAYAQSRYDQAKEILKTEREISSTQSKTADKSKTSTAENNNQKLAMSAEEATKKVRSLNGTLTQQKRVLKDLEENGIGSKSLIKLGEWDKSSNSFKKNSDEIQKLVSRYNELKKARIDAGGAGKPAVGEEASLRGKLSALLREQKKHVAEIIAQNQQELETARQISAEYKQTNKNRTATSKTNTTKHLDELIAKLNTAKATLESLKSNKFDAIGKTGLGDVNKRLEAAGSKQGFEELINVYNRLIAKRDELEKAGKTGSSEYIQLAKIYQGVEQQLSVIYQDQLKYTQSRIQQIETEIAKEKEVLGLKQEQTKEDAKRQAGTGTNKATSTGTGHTSTVKLDGATLNSLAKDATLRAIDGKINNILSTLGKGVVINGSNISIEAGNVSVSGKGASAGGGTKGAAKDPGEKEVKLSTISSYSQQLVALEERIKRTGLYTDDLKQKFVDLNAQLNAIRVQDDADTYKFYLDRFKEDFEQLKTYDKLYQDFIKSQARQIQLNDKIATSNGPTAELQEQLKIEEEKSRAIEEQLSKYTTLYNQRARQLAIDEAIKKANQEIAQSSAAQSDKDINKQNNELIKIVDNAQKKLNDMQYSMQNSKVPMADAAIAKFKQYEQLLTTLKIKQQEIVANPDLLKDSGYKDGFNSLLLQMQKVQSEFVTLQQSSESFLSKIKSMDDIKPLGSTFDATNLAQLHNEMQNFANQAGVGAAKLIEFNDVERTATFEIQNGKGQVHQLTVAYDEATNSLGRYTSKTRESLSETQKFFNSIKGSFRNVARYIASFGSVYRLFSIIRQGVTYVKEIDSALTELKKVTDETDATYNKFLQSMSKTASVTGSTVKELTSSAADWARLGSIVKSAPLYSNI